MTTYLIGTISGVRAYCHDHRRPIQPIMRGADPEVRYLGIEADRICGVRPKPGDEFHLVYGAELMKPAARAELRRLQLLASSHTPRTSDEETRIPSRDE